MDALPLGDMGSKNLPVPALPSLPAEIGDREVSASPKVKDGLEPIIFSLDLITESMENISSVVSDADMERITISELDRLFQKYLSKPFLADAIALALTRQSPPAVDSSLMVRQQVKADEVIKRQPAGKFEDVFSKQQSSSSSSKSSSKKGMSFEEGYNKVVNTAYEATHDPLKLVDKIIPAVFSLFKKKDSENSKEKTKEKESFYGEGEVEEGSFYGSFGKQATEVVGGTVENVSDVGAKGIKGATDVGATGIVGAKALLSAALGTNLNAGLEGDVNPGVVGATGAGGGSSEEDGRPLGTITDPIYILNAGGSSESGGATSSVDDIQEEAAEVGIKADESLRDTLENPDQSSFVRAINGDNEKGGKKGKAEKGGAGLGTVLIAGMILAALIIFKDVVEKVFDKVIIPLGEVLIDFLTQLKQPLIDLISAIISVVVVVLDVIKDILVEIKPFLIEIASAICGIVITVLGIVQEVLLAIKPYIIQIAEVIAGTVVVALNLIKGVLEALQPHLIAIAGLLGSMVAKIVGAIHDIINIITYPIRLISRILDTIEPHIIRIANFIGGVIADWFEENEDTIKKMMDSTAELVTSLNKFTAEFLSGLDAAAIGTAVSNVIGGTLTTIATFLGLLNGVLNLLKPPLIALNFVGNILLAVMGAAIEALASGLSMIPFGWAQSAANTIRTSWADANAVVAPGGSSSSSSPDDESSSSIGLFSALVGVLGDDDGFYDEDADEKSFLKLISTHTAVIANILIEMNKDGIHAMIDARKSEDLIISSDGRIFETSPSDAIFAVQNGSVSTQATSPVLGVSTRSVSSSEPSQGSTSSNVTNVYNSSTNVDSSGVSPFSEFCPVGV